MSVTKNKELVAIAVVDDDFSVCELVSRHINTLDKCKVVFKAVSGEQLLEKLKLNAEINIIILDIMMDGMNGYDVAKLVRKKYPDIRQKEQGYLVRRLCVY